MAPRKPDTQWVHFRRARPELGRGGSPARPPVPYGPPTACTRYAGTIHRNPCDLLSHLPLHLPVYRCPSIISAPPADFDHQFDYGCHSRRTRHFGVSLARFPFARSDIARENKERESGRGGPFGAARLPFAAGEEEQGRNNLRSHPFRVRYSPRSRLTCRQVGNLSADIKLDKVLDLRYNFAIFFSKRTRITSEDDEFVNPRVSVAFALIIPVRRTR